MQVVTDVSVSRAMRVSSVIRRRMNASLTPASTVETARTSPMGTHAAVGQVLSYLWTFVISNIYNSVSLCGLTSVSVLHEYQTGICV